jgi:nucleoid-associated protein YgaU
MPERPNLQKAKIFRVDNPSRKVDCHFNPNEYSIGRTIKWERQTKKGKDVSKAEYAGGEAQDLTIRLLFDTTDKGTDVRDTYKELLQMAEPDMSKKDPKTRKSEPPVCQFQWGTYLSYTGVITKITQRFTMFKADGMPLRAEVEVALSQTAEEKQGQNPTTRTEPRKIWVVHEGQTLDWIAYQEYGDPGHWRHIAEINDLANPKDLKPGQILKLVPLL